MPDVGKNESKDSDSTPSPRRKLSIKLFRHRQYCSRVRRKVRHGECLKRHGRRKRHRRRNLHRSRQRPMDEDRNFVPIHFLSRTRSRHSCRNRRPHSVVGNALDRRGRRARQLRARRARLQSLPVFAHLLGTDSDVSDTHGKSADASRLQIQANNSRVECDSALNTRSDVNTSYITQRVTENHASPVATTFHTPRSPVLSASTTRTMPVRETRARIASLYSNKL